MSERSTYVDSARLPWRESPYPGVRWKKLSYDPGTGRSAVLLEFDAGAAYGRHRHPAGERYLVLRGALLDGGGTWGEGSWVEHPPGSVHRPSSPEGCVLLVELERPIEDLERR